MGEVEWSRRRTSSEKSSLSPIHRQHTPRSETDALGKVHAAPEIHGQQPAAEIHAAEIENSGVADIRQAAEMLVFECLVDSRVDVAVFDIVGMHTREGCGDFGEFAAEVFALLVGSLRGGGEGGEFGVDLVEEFIQFVVVEGAGLVLVILLEELV